MDQVAEFEYGLGMQVDFTTEDNGEGCAEARRRRKMEVKKERGFIKKKRNTFYSRRGFVPPPLPPCITDRGRMVFLFPKKLQNSDVNKVGRIVLPKKPTETHLPRLLDNESIILPVVDMDGVDVWPFKFRYWANNQSRMYVFEGTGSFTKKHTLGMGDYMLMYMDMVTRNYVIRAVKACEVEGCANNQGTHVCEDNADFIHQNWSLPSDFEFEAFNLPEEFTNFHKMEDPLAMTSMNDESYFSDILNSFSSWDEFMTNYYPATQPSVSFSNLSSEDLSQV